MKSYRGPDGSHRLWFEPSEIEEMMEDELRKAGLLPGIEDPSVNLERFIEGYLRAHLDQYAKLDLGVLGVTEFRPPLAPKVSINCDLTGSALDEDETPPGILGRWRATLAHEAAHIILHRVLFEVPPEENLFGDPTLAAQAQRLFRCLKRDVGFGANPGDWCEIQANRGMAALLMPKPIFFDVARRQIRSLGISQSSLVAGSSPLLPLIRELSEQFKVSKQAATIRLESTGLVSPRAQARLT